MPVRVAIVVAEVPGRSGFDRATAASAVREYGDEHRLKQFASQAMTRIPVTLRFGAIARLATQPLMIGLHPRESSLDTQGGYEKLWVIALLPRKKTCLFAGKTA